MTSTCLDQYLPDDEEDGSKLIPTTVTSTTHHRQPSKKILARNSGVHSSLVREKKTTQFQINLEIISDE